jgi:transposase-like protein
MSKPRRLFTRERKVEAIKLSTAQGRSFAEAAHNLETQPQRTYTPSPDLPTSVSPDND